MRRIACALAALLLFSTNARPAEPPRKAVSGVALALPKLAGVSARWALASAPADASAARSWRLAAGPDGRPWFFDAAAGLLLEGGSERAVALDRPIEDFAWMPGGDPVACTKEMLGFISFDEGASATAQFVPLLPLAYGNCRLFPGGADTLYLIERDPAGGEEQLFALALKGGTPSVAKLLSTKSYIGAAAGEGGELFFSIGDRIFRVRPGASEPELYFKARREITGLQYSSAAGLFFATPDGIGFAGPNFQLRFLVAPHPEFALAGGALLARPAGGFSVLAIDGADRFAETR